MGELGAASLKDILDKVAGSRVVVVGDVMLDRHVTGSVGRVSPEGPIPVLHVVGESSSPGGAANVAEKAAALGASVALVGVVGDDDGAGEILRTLEDRGVDVSGLVVAGSRPTTVKTRFIARTQQMLRVDRESRSDLEASVAEAVVASAVKALDGAGAVVLEDYGKGVLGGGVAGRIIDKARELGVSVVVDPTVTMYSRYKGAAIVTPNEQEARDAYGPGGYDVDLTAVAGKLGDHAGGAIIAVTRGGDGITLFAGAEGEEHCPARRVEVFDVTGAGDAVAAAFGAAMAAGLCVREASELANLAGGAVVAQLGPGRISAELLARSLSGDGGASGKLMSRDDSARWAEASRLKGETVVFTNGCFDLLHAGHVKLLESAAKFGDRLVVGINSDESISRLKGAGRPVLPMAERSHMLGALAAVDCVVVFDEDTPALLIEAIRPEILVKGSDYTEETVGGADVVATWGGRVELIDLVEGISTTALIERLRSGGE